MINWFKNYSKSTKKLTIKNVFNFLVAWFRYKMPGKQWVEDQAKWRSLEIQKSSPGCLERGYCLECYCDFPEKLYETEGCNLCYPEWMNKKEWFLFLKTKK